MVTQHGDRAGMKVARTRIVTEPGPHPQDIVEDAEPSSPTVGQRAVNFSKYGPTAFTVVCCSMISDSQTR
jgi:hypothetical protein